MGAFDRELLRRLKNDLCAKRFRTAVRTAKQLWRFRTRNSSITLHDQAFQESCLRCQVARELLWCTNLGYREAQVEFGFSMSNTTKLFALALSLNCFPMCCSFKVHQ